MNKVGRKVNVNLKVKCYASNGINTNKYQALILFTNIFLFSINAGMCLKVRSNS